MTESFDITELLALAKDNVPESRSRLFGLMGDLFLNKGGYLSTEERSNLSEILSTLLPQADKESRLKLAYDLSGSTAVPRELTRRMAEDEIEVASPILFKSTKLTDQDLIELAARTPEHAGVIATRRGLPMAVADSLMRSGKIDVVQALLDNASAQISIAALHAALERSKSSDDLQDSISRRVELPEEIAAELMEWAGDRVRERLMDRFNILMIEIAPASELDEELRPLDLTQFNKANGIATEPEPDLGDTPATGFARYGASSRATPASSLSSTATPAAPQIDAEEDARLEAARLAEADAARAKAKKDLVTKTLAALAQDTHAEPAASAAPIAEEHFENRGVTTFPVEEPTVAAVDASPIETHPIEAHPIEAEEVDAAATPPVRREAAAARMTFESVDMELELIEVGDSGEIPVLAEPIARTDRESAMTEIEKDLELEFAQASAATPDAAPMEIEPAPAEPVIAVESAVPAEPVIAAGPGVATEPEITAMPLDEAPDVEPPAAEPAAEPPMPEPVAQEPALEAPIATGAEAEPSADQKGTAIATAEAAEPQTEAAHQVPAEAAPQAPVEAVPGAMSEPRKEAAVVNFIKSALAAAAKALPGAAAQTPAAGQPAIPIPKEETAPEPAESPSDAVSEQPAAEPEPAAPMPEPKSEPVKPAVAARGAIPKGAEHKLTTALLIAMLNNGGLPHAEAMFAQMTGLRIDLVRRLAAESGGEGLVMAARAIHMSRADFSAIYLLWRKLKSRDGFVPTSDHGKALDFFDSAPQDRVISVINRWRKDPEKLFATG